MGRIDEWRARLDARARDRQARFRRLDGQLREAVEKREVPRPRKADMPAEGTLPPDVAVLVDDGQVHRGVTLLANLTGAERAEAEHAVALYLQRRPSAPPG